MRAEVIETLLRFYLKGISTATSGGVGVLGKDAAGFQHPHRAEGRCRMITRVAEARSVSEALRLHLGDGIICSRMETSKMYLVLIGASRGRKGTRGFTMHEENAHDCANFCSISSGAARRVGN